MKEYDLGVINANVENMLIQAQQGLEKAIQEYGEAVDVYGDSIVTYRKAKAEAVRRLKANGTAVTIIQDLAAGEVAEHKAEMVKAEGKMKRIRMLVDAYIERINGIKYIGRRTDDLANKG